MDFEWDDNKAKGNLDKHGVSFEEAQTVFSAPLAAIFNDEWHSGEEMREIIVGQSLASRLLLVCFVQRVEIVRLISARPATKRERKEYEENVS